MYFLQCLSFLKTQKHFTTLLNVKTALTYLTACLFLAVMGFSQSSEALLQKGWAELVKDNDTSALRLFSAAYQVAEKNNDREAQANALLHLGIASYGSSLFNGMIYATKALQEYEQLKPTQARVSELGRAKCLILIATIKARQGKYVDARGLALEALHTSNREQDTSSSIGLAHFLLGAVYAKLNKTDSSDFHYREALNNRILRNERAYLPLSYSAMGDLELRLGHSQQSFDYYQKALAIAEATQNRQAQISILISQSKWYDVKDKNSGASELLLQGAKRLAEGVSDQSYLATVLTHLKTRKKNQGKYNDALELEEQIIALKETISANEKEHLTRSLEVQFGLSEKERELNLIKKEKELSTLTNYFLYTALAAVIVMAGGAILFLRRINKRDKQLLQSREDLFRLAEEQKKLKEQQLRNELEFKESQLSALTIQMIQKNELLQDLKEKLENSSHQDLDASVTKILNRGLNQDKEWSDFNAHFESINKNFYTRIKQSFPDISPNELKICALIKMNLSIKEMASILNISPDSVKTARYRLRKKLNLSTEDNLTEFILNLN
jgi:DNA-binding CsgD family transcriptional regulator